MLKKILSWAAVFGWLLVIYNFSAQSAKESSELSRGLSRYLYSFINRVLPQQITVQGFHLFLRSGAHFFIFFVLALLLINAFRVSGYSDYKVVLYTLITAVACAFADEFHQLFVPGRGAQFKDILIDSLGIISAVVLYLLAMFSNI
jgi:VanZ family protein